MPASRRRLLPLALLVLAVVLVGILLWKGSWGPSDWRAVDAGAPPRPDELGDPRLMGTEDARTEAGAATAGRESGFAGCAVRGRVVDAETGQPVSEAYYFLWPLGEPPPENSPYDWVEAVEGETEVFGKVFYAADAGGRFALRGDFAAVGRGAPLALHVLADGYVYQVVPFEIPGAVEVRLERGGTIRGHVVDPARRSVRGARVRARTPWPPLPRSGLFGVQPVVAETTTDEEGAFVLSGLDPQETVVWVEARAEPRLHAAPVPVDARRDESVEIVLEPRRAVTLEIFTNDGGGMPRAHLSAPPTRWNTLLWKAGWQPAPSRRVVGPVDLPPGRVVDELRVWVPGYAQTRIEIDPHALDPRHEVEMYCHLPVGTARGRLSWPPELVAGGREPNPVFLRVRAGGVFWMGEPAVPVRRVVPGGTEQVVVGPLPQRRYDLQVVGVEVAHVGVDLVVLGGEEGQLDLRLEPAGTVEVVFLDAPPTGVAFSLQDADGLQETTENERLLPSDDRLPGGLRWSRALLAAPAGEGRAAVGRLLGLRAGRYLVGAPDVPRGYPEWTEVHVTAGRTTRVEIPRAE